MYDGTVVYSKFAKVYDLERMQENHVFIIAHDEEDDDLNDNLEKDLE